jgi:hypothetical protein
MTWVLVAAMLLAAVCLFFAWIDWPQDDREY